LIAFIFLLCFIAYFLGMIIGNYNLMDKHIQEIEKNKSLQIQIKNLKK